MINKTLVRLRTRQNAPGVGTNDALSAGNPAS